MDVSIHFKVLIHIPQFLLYFCVNVDNIFHHHAYFAGFLGRKISNTHFISMAQYFPQYSKNAKYRFKVAFWSNCSNSFVCISYFEPSRCAIAIQKYSGFYHLGKNNNRHFISFQSGVGEVKRKYNLGTLHKTTSISFLSNQWGFSSDR